ncbi:helix-turn-helix domain-containing protein [Sorangium sp. So ce1036]|uniref:GlxA family transcriptional regulator n=1 Tax=Sorangium sp. So ce1036 TaxID=3133328 RepID=UPI003F0F3AB1
MVAAPAWPAAGLLDGRRAATHWRSAPLLAERHPRVRVDADSVYLRDGSIWTSAGISAGIDLALALALVEEDLGHRAAMAVARQLVVFLKRPGGQSQFSAPLAAQAAEGGTFADLHAWMADHLAGDLRVERLAAQAGMSPRTFARAYTAALGQTPAKVVAAMRLEAACQAVAGTDLPLHGMMGRPSFHAGTAIVEACAVNPGAWPGQPPARVRAMTAGATPGVACLLGARRGPSRGAWLVHRSSA